MAKNISAVLSAYGARTYNDSVITGITGLNLWLRARDLALSDGANVVTWTDQSGTSNNATGPSAHQPIFKINIISGWPVVRFGPVASLAYMLYTNSVMGASGHCSIFVVGAVQQAVASEHTYAPFIIDSTGVNGMRICDRLAASNWGTFVGADLSSGEDLATGTFNILELITGQPGSTLYRNGVSKATSGSNAQGGTQNSIGAEVGQSRYAVVDVAEIICYNAVLSTGNRQIVEGYLNQVYALF